jgi:hypothetical protein
MNRSGLDRGLVLSAIDRKSMGLIAFTPVNSIDEGMESAG